MESVFLFFSFGKVSTDHTPTQLQPGIDTWPTELPVDWHSGYVLLGALVLSLEFFERFSSSLLLQKPESRKHLPIPFHDHFVFINLTKLDVDMNYKESNDYLASFISLLKASPALETVCLEVSPYISLLHSNSFCCFLAHMNVHANLFCFILNYLN